VRPKERPTPGGPKLDLREPARLRTDPRKVRNQ
jgi:hypothetical protein